MPAGQPDLAHVVRLVRGRLIGAFQLRYFRYVPSALAADELDFGLPETTGEPCERQGVQGPGAQAQKMELEKRPIEFRQGIGVQGPCPIRAGDFRSQRLGEWRDPKCQGGLPPRAVLWAYGHMFATICRQVPDRFRDIGSRCRAHIRRTGPVRSKNLDLRRAAR